MNATHICLAIRNLGLSIPPLTSPGTFFFSREIMPQVAVFDDGAHSIDVAGTIGAWITANSI
jgi:hypothetical protein